MKRYDLSKIMKDAHRMYRYSYKKRGKTFGQALHLAWFMAKSLVEAEEREKREQRRKEEEARKREEWTKQEHFTSESIYNRMDIPESAFYSANSTGLYGAHYVGD